MPERHELAESTPLAEATRGQPTGRRMRVRLISPGWGSSGYYSPKVLQEAAKAGVFPAGTHTYLDHPTATEDAERPERSVRDLAGMLATDGVWESDGIYADVDVFGPFQQVLTEMKDAIGLSIRAIGTAEHGEVDGQPGTIITALTEARSVDFVTKAGRGGRIVEVIESARKVGLTEARNIGQWLEARLHTAFTELTDGMYGDGRLTREERITLSGGIGDALKSFTARIEADAPQLFKRDLWEDPEKSATAVEENQTASTTPPTNPKEAPVSGTTSTTGTPAPAGGDNAPTQPVQEAATDPRVAELERQLAEARAQAEVRTAGGKALADAERQLAEVRSQNQRLVAAEDARHETAKALAESTLFKACHADVYAKVIGLEGRALPLQESGVLDKEKLATSIKAVIAAEEAKAAAILEEAGVGRPRGLGASKGNGADLSEADVEKELGDVFGRIGLDEATAKIAAKGR